MKTHPHTFAMWSAISRLTCTHCGLVWLRNERSNQAARATCKWWND